MKMPHLFSILTLFFALGNPSFAMISVGNVSKERAAELGVELRARAGGPEHAWIELEFKTEGTLAKFKHVSIEVPDGDELALGWTPLKDRRTSSGSVMVRLMGSRKFLEKVTLRIVHGDLGSRGLDLRIKDFVDFEKLSKPKPSNGSQENDQEGAGQPATDAGSKPE